MFTMPKSSHAFPGSQILTDLWNFPHWGFILIVQKLPVPAVPSSLTLCMQCQCRSRGDHLDPSYQHFSLAHHSSASSTQNAFHYLVKLSRNLPCLWSTFLSLLGMSHRRRYDLGSEERDQKVPLELHWAHLLRHGPHSDFTFSEFSYKAATARCDVHLVYLKSNDRLSPVSLWELEGEVHFPQHPLTMSGSHWVLQLVDFALAYKCLSIWAMPLQGKQFTGSCGI